MNQKVRKSVLLIGVCLCGMFTMQLGEAILQYLPFNSRRRSLVL